VPATDVVNGLPVLCSRVGCQLFFRVLAREFMQVEMPIRVRSQPALVDQSGQVCQRCPRHGLGCLRRKRPVEDRHPAQHALLVLVEQ